MEETRKRHDIPTEEIGQLLDVVSQKIPHLLKSIKELIYSPESGTEMGQAVGNFYKELIASGLDAGLASELTREYLKTLQTVSKGFNINGDR